MEAGLLRLRLSSVEADGKLGQTIRLQEKQEKQLRRPPSLWPGSLSSCMLVGFTSNHI